MAKFDDATPPAHKFGIEKEMHQPFFPRIKDQAKSDEFHRPMAPYKAYEEKSRVVYDHITGTAHEQRFRVPYFIG